MVSRTCKKCGFTAPTEWFRQSRFTSKSTLVRRAICPMCEQEARDKHKHQNRAITKARTMLYNHAKKYKMRPREFARKFGWSIKHMVHDINHNFENWCPYCRQPYKGMGHGLRDLTLDIINPNQLPYYTNIRYCCSTCNSIKGQRGAETFGLHLTQVAKREEYLAAQNGTLLKPQHRMQLDGNN